MSDVYTKANLVKELALAAQISKRRAEAVLETLTQIAYREAPNGFVVPGICRLDVVERKARLVRNPGCVPTRGRLLAGHIHNPLARPAWDRSCQTSSGL